MIIYSPLDGDAITSLIPSNPRHCFLMTRLGKSVPSGVKEIRNAVTAICIEHDYSVIDASARVTGRDFLLKIWRQIASAPLAVGVAHEDIPATSQANIYYELGVAQALGKETVIVKSVGAKVPSDFIRTEYIEFDELFAEQFSSYLESIIDQADHYETVADQLERNPILAIDYLKRAFLITGDEKYRTKAQALKDEAGLEERAANSVEILAATF
jgi:hypothetical protein